MAEWGAQHIGLRICQIDHPFFGKVSVCGYLFLCVEIEKLSQSLPV